MHPAGTSAGRCTARWPSPPARWRPGSPRGRRRASWAGARGEEECTFCSANWKRTQGARNVFRVRDCFRVREVAPGPEINAASADESACRFFLYNMQTGDELDFEFLGGHYLHTNVIVKGLTAGPGGKTAWRDQYMILLQIGCILRRFFG